MFILDNPYVSDFLQDTALKCGFPVLKNSAAQSLGLNPALDYICNSQAIEKIQNGEKIYCNSENAIDMSETILAYVRSIKSFSNFEPCIISAMI